MFQLEENFKTHPLWAEEYWKIRAFFEKDNTVKVSDVYTVNNDHYCVISVEDPKKALYIAELIKTFDLEVRIEDGLSDNEKLAYICENNPIFHELVEVIDPESGVVKYSALEFEPTCMHWYSDDFFSPTGHTAILPYQLAKEIFNGRGINYQTHFEV